MIVLYHRSRAAAAVVCVGALLTLTAGVADAALIIWEGDLDVAAFTEGNWTGENELPGPNSNPLPNGTIEGNQAIPFDMLVETREVGNVYGAQPAQVGPVNNVFFIGGGFELTVGQEARFLMNTNPVEAQGGRAIRGPNGMNRAIVTVRDNALVRVENFLAVEVNVQDAADIVIDSPTGPFNSSPLSITPGWSGAIEFLSIAPATVAGLAFLNAADVGGQPAVLGGNVELLSNGNGGTLLVYVPEPAAGLLIGFGAALGCLRRRVLPMGG